MRNTTWLVSSTHRNIEKVLKVTSTVVTYVAEDFQSVIEAISRGDIEPKKMITKVIGLHQVAEEGFKTLVEDKDNQVKILIDISKTST